AFHLEFELPSPGPEDVTYEIRELGADRRWRTIASKIGRNEWTTVGQAMVTTQRLDATRDHVQLSEEVIGGDQRKSVRLRCLLRGGNP
ncbi:MAG: hypothetical protein AAF514_24365, partial [Verrucomicrobiota bacterium]